MGTIEEIKEHISGSLASTGRYYTESGMTTTFFRGVTGSDGMPLLGMGSINKVQTALNELEQEGEIESRPYDGSELKEYRSKLKTPHECNCHFCPYG